MKKIFILSVFILTFACLRMHATAQYEEVLVWKGDTVKMYSEPLALNNKLYSLIQERLPDLCSTALWRGYIGSWVIDNDSLFLDNIRALDGNKIDISDLIMDYKVANNKVFASWVTDTLRIVSGELMQYIHMGWESIYEKEWDIIVEKGIIKKVNLYENKILIKSMSDIDFINIIQEFPFEKYPKAQNIVICVNGVNMDSNSGEISYDLKMIFPKNREYSVEEQSELYNVIQDFIKEKKIVPIYIYRGKLVGAQYVIPLRKRKLSDTNK